jgi:hypothetical protein
MRGVLAPTSTRRRVGIVASGGWSGWHAVAAGLGWDIAVVAVGDGALGTAWTNQLVQSNIHTVSHLDFLASCGDPTFFVGIEILLFEDRLPPRASPIWKIDSLQMALCNSAPRRACSPPGWFHKTLDWEHARCGGVTGAVGTVGCWVRDKSFLQHLVLPVLPRRQLSSILSSTQGGRSVPPPGSATWPPKVTTTQFDGRLGFHADGLLPLNLGSTWVDMPDCLSRTGWVRRRLTRQEVLTAADVPSDFHDDVLFQSPLLGVKALLGAPIGVLRLLGVSINLCFFDDSSSSLSSRPPGNVGGLLPTHVVDAGGCSPGQFGGLLPLASEVSSHGEHTHVVDAGGSSVSDTVKRKFREAVTLRNEREEEREVRARITQTEKDNDVEVEEPPEPNSIAQADQASEVGPQMLPVDLELANGAQQQAEFDAAKKKYAVATKSDDAAVPTHLWDQRALRLAEDVLPTQSEKKALNMMRNACLKFWKRTTVKDLCSYLGSRNKKKHGKLHHVAPVSEESSHSYQGSTVPIRKWSSSGQGSYSTWWHSESRLDKDTKVGLDCVRRVADCTWWEWDGGSTLFFWRWPEEFRVSVRDGTRLWIHEDKLPKYRRPQRDVSEVTMKRAMIQKLLKVKTRRYFEEGLVSALTSFFAVPKGADDIRMVYDGTASGLNEALWAPWFTHRQSNLI